jgi:hypothetical protein
MSSFSRSGETLLLRCLDAHPDIHVVHQIREPDADADLALWKFLMDYEPTEIPHDHELIQAAGVKEGAVLLLKNAVWTHPYPYNGFVLVRNPFAVVNSFKILNEDDVKYNKRKQQYRRWARQIDAKVLPLINKEPDNITCLCALYNVKMAPLAKLGLPILRYEDFVTYPETYLNKICDYLGVVWNDLLLKSHTLYSEGELGHGGIPLWKPIHTGSLHSYQKLPKEVISKIYSLTKPVYEMFGYQYKNNKITTIMK